MHGHTNVKNWFLGYPVHSVGTNYEQTQSCVFLKLALSHTGNYGMRNGKDGRSVFVSAWKPTQVISYN